MYSQSGKGRTGLVPLLEEESRVRQLSTLKNQPHSSLASGDANEGKSAEVAAEFSHRQEKGKGVNWPARVRLFTFPALPVDRRGLPRKKADRHAPSITLISASFSAFLYHNSHAPPVLRLAQLGVPKAMARIDDEYEQYLEQQRQREYEEYREQQERKRDPGPSTDPHGRLYMEWADCDFCGNALEGRGFTCEVCGALVCTSCACDDGKCPECTRMGDYRPDAKSRRQDLL